MSPDRLLPIAQDTVAADTSAIVVVPPPTAAAVRYYRSGNALWALGTAWSLAVPLLLLATGLSARLRTLAGRIGRRWVVGVTLYGVLFVAVTGLLWLPLAFYSGYLRQHAYGLSTQPLGDWLADAAKGLGVAALLVGLTLWIPYLLIRRSPRRWWLYTALAGIPIVLLLQVAGPVLVDPLFDEFRPLQDRALAERIVAVAERAGIEHGRVYEVAKSAETRAVNAYVTGMGGTQRIVLWDTLLDRLDDREVLFVVAHEIGHYVLGHVLIGAAVSALLLLAALYTVHRVAGAVLRRWGDRIGVHELGDVASLPLLVLIGTAVSLVIGPVALALSRHQEREADRFALELTGDHRACGRTFVALQAENLQIPRPGPLVMLLRATHPSLGERVDFCNRYRP